MKGWERIDVLVSGIANLALGSETVSSTNFLLIRAMVVEIDYLKSTGKS